MQNWVKIGTVLEGSVHCHHSKRHPFVSEHNMNLLLDLRNCHTKFGYSIGFQMQSEQTDFQNTW